MDTSDTPSTLLMTLDEVAADLRVTRRHVERMVAAGDLPTLRLGRAVRVPRAAVVALVEGAA